MYKRDEGKRRQISGPRNFVSDAKMYRYTKGTRNQGRGQYGNYRGRDFGNINRNNNRYNDQREQNEGRDHASNNRRYNDERNANDSGAHHARMNKFIEIAGKYAQNRRTYDHNYDNDNESVGGESVTGQSSGKTGSVMSEKREAESVADSLELNSEEEIATTHMRVKATKTPSPATPE